MFDLTSRVPADVAGRCVLCDKLSSDLNGYGECIDCSFACEEGTNDLGQCRYCGLPYEEIDDGVIGCPECDY